MKDGSVMGGRNIRKERRQVNFISTHAHTPTPATPSSPSSPSPSSPPFPPSPPSRHSPPLHLVRYPTRLISIFMIHLERLRFPGWQFQRIPKGRPWLTVVSRKEWASGDRSADGFLAEVPDVIFARCRFGGIPAAEGMSRVNNYHHVQHAAF